MYRKILGLNTLVLTITLLVHDCHSALSLTAVGQGINDVLKSASYVSVGVVKNVATTLPTPEAIFEWSKNDLLGFPAEVVFSAINQICSAALSSDAIKPRITPDLKEMNFQFRTTCNTYNYAILDVVQIEGSPEFDRTKPVVVLATGWQTTIDNSSAIDEFAKAYACRGDTNFIVSICWGIAMKVSVWRVLNKIKQKRKQEESDKL